MYHTFKVQAPSEREQRKVFEGLQRVLDGLVFGSVPTGGRGAGVRIATAKQPVCDGGIAHLDIELRVKAEWAHLASQLADARPAAWKNIWWSELWKTYGPLCDRDLLTTRCTYALLMGATGPSQVQRQAMKAWGALHIVPVHQVWPEPSPAMQRRAALARYDGEPPPEPKPTWERGVCEATGAQVGEERLWFNPSMDLSEASNSRMHARSTADTEREAILWAEKGVLRVRDIINGTRIMGHRSFKQQFPTLDDSLVHTFRTDLPERWRHGLQDGTATSWGAGNLPANLLGPGSDRQVYATAYKDTLIKRAYPPHPQPTNYCSRLVPSALCYIRTLNLFASEGRRSDTAVHTIIYYVVYWYFGVESNCLILHIRRPGHTFIYNLVRS